MNVRFSALRHTIASPAIPVSLLTYDNLEFLVGRALVNGVARLSREKSVGRHLHAYTQDKLSAHSELTNQGGRGTIS